MLVLIFAIFIASLGLNTDSIPVIIGAMLISPLMGPIIGMGLAIGIEDFSLLKRSLKNIVMAIIGSLLASAIYFMISPQYEGSSQLLARTSPSIYDVFVALFGGAAGIVSLQEQGSGNAGRCDSHLIDASFVYCRIWYCNIAITFLLWCALSILHKYDIHIVCISYRGEIDEL